MIELEPSFGAVKSDVCIAYALTSYGDDAYIRMTALSVQSAIVAMPGLRVIVALDDKTAWKAGDAVRAALPPAVELLVIETPVGGPIWRNRFVKSILRRRLSGPFIYLDADTIVRRDLTTAYDWDFDVAAVSNHNAPNCSVPENELDIFMRCGWAVPEVAYFNAGVQFWRDTSAAHDLSKLYHKAWLQVSNVTGRPQDQQAFNYAVGHAAAKVAVLPDEFNAQINSAPQIAFDALLWHYFESDKSIISVPRTVFGEAASEGSTANAVIMMHAPHPWVVTNVLDAFAIHSFRTNTGLLGDNDWRRWWLCGDRVAFAKYLFRRALRLFLRLGRFGRQVSK